MRQESMISIFALSKKHAARTSCFNFVPYKNHQIIKKSRDVTPVTDGGKWKIVQCSGRPETAKSFVKSVSSVSNLTSRNNLCGGAISISDGIPVYFCFIVTFCC